MDWKQVSFRELSRIEYALYTASRPNAHQVILLAKFTGVYGLGSRGSHDAAFMRATVVAALDVWTPSGLILDLRQLEYQWGDEMTGVLCAGDRYFGGSDVPATLIVSNQCREGLTTLLAQELGEDPADWLFDDPVDAAAALEAKLCSGDAADDTQDPLTKE